MTYQEQMKNIAEQIISQCSALYRLEENRNDWVKPEGHSLMIGSNHYYAVRKDGSVTPGLEAVQAEMLKLIDNQIFKANSKLEGLRFQMIQLGKTGAIQ
ncbi:DUF4461 domain-containing protein [Polynucleobacter sp. UK-Kesae-W10]|uniref:DUF4461 domain-containing protein n=1 Tax=Polynucleobacter sp. UK-Kesae-W10 TaxID=1819738 RepID=UPI001C0C4F1B|nr:DUF4461 domain-containing protein [Polynucleobacter sp. UK-Kesae-W10]MBU3577547.1 hypothetical protein [Polynucleobacter sp. UK-Kesae-W10]